MAFFGDNLISLTLLMLFILISCNDDKGRPANENTNAANQTTNLKAGGIYLLKNKDSTYYLAKILVIDDVAVHLRTYQDTFRTKPTDINSEDLKILIGHAPLDKNGFLLDKPELLKIEEVKESELDGYKMYMKAMGN